MDVEQSALIVKKALESGKGCFIGRWGTIEFEMLWNAEPSRFRVLERNAGVFPMRNLTHLQEWRNTYMDAIQNADVLATGWFAPIKALEEQYLKYMNWRGQQIVLRGLEPYYVKGELQWTQALKGKKVCIVSSFTETGKKQMAKGNEKIWKHDFWPSDVEWSWVQTGYAPVLAKGICEWPNQSKNWKDAVKYVVSEVIKNNPDVVLIGCGGLGMIVASELKGLGKSCVVMGGAIQVFLGIKGHRWATHDIISKFWNDEWVFPSAEETPGGSKDVEGGCYW